MIVSASASLHHRRCRRPEWNGSGRINLSGAQLLSYPTRVLMGPFPPTQASGEPFAAFDAAGQSRPGAGDAAPRSG
jgi:hypothetical protein